MKKLILSILFLAFAFVATAQNFINLKQNVAARDSVYGAQTVYYYFNKPFTQHWGISAYVYIDMSVVTTDSTWVTWQGSFDTVQAHFVTINLGTPYLIGYALYNTPASGPVQAKLLSASGAGGWLWTPTWYTTFPYIRLKVQHYKAATSVIISKAQLYLTK